MRLVPVEPSDCWQLVGQDDATTPPSVSRVLHTAATRSEWRRAGFPVLFDDTGNVKQVVRNGRVYRFEKVDEEVARRMPHPPPRD